jgi:DNA polymerase elongation subunit (family B)
MHGILIDVFQKKDLLVIWICAHGKNKFFVDAFKPVFYVGGTKKELLEVKDLLEKEFWPNSHTASIARRKDLEAHKRITVLKVEVNDFRFRNSMVKLIEKKKKYALQLYDADVQIEQLYLFHRNIRPLQEVVFSVQGGQVKGLKEKPFHPFTETFPALKTARFEIISKEEEDFLNPIEYIRLNDTFFRGTEEQMLLDFKKAYGRLDPDVVITNRGSRFDIPYLKQKMAEYKLSFSFGRFADSFYEKIGKSYFSYGRIVRKNPAHYFNGRLHIESSSFHFQECNLEGLLEVAYSTCMPIQKTSQKGSGTCLSNLQLFVAFSMGYLIPLKKNQVEKFNTAWNLFEIDKGGLVYEPVIGLHDNVVELDFSSLYPSIMVHHNISPETLFCTCCPDNTVPDAGFTICKKRKGFIPIVLKPLLERRLYFKRMRALTEGDEKTAYEEKCTALKWLLVVSFGYTGYRNARFGRIEAHQAICAYARDILVKTAHICEKRGFNILHAIVDAVYLRKASFGIDEIEILIKEINKKTSMEIILEGVFKWVVFLPRVNQTTVSALTRFYGMYQNGEHKVRGVQLRRRDTPKAVKLMQEKQIRILGHANDAAEFQNKIPAALRVLKEWVAKISNGLIPIEQLAVKKAVTRTMEKYKANCAQKAILQQLYQKGIDVHPGESIEFVYSNMNAGSYLSRVRLVEEGVKIDVEKYIDLFVRGTFELFNFMGLTKKKLAVIASQAEQMFLTDFVEKEEVIVSN